ncbi:hypothetical protein VTK56DRAFT_8349 [Thermocarpiscus australiensis]
MHGEALIFIGTRDCELCCHQSIAAVDSRDQISKQASVPPSTLLQLKKRERSAGICPGQSTGTRKGLGAASNRALTLGRQFRRPRNPVPACAYSIRHQPNTRPCHTYAYWLGDWVAGVGYLIFAELLRALARSPLRHVHGCQQRGDLLELRPPRRW